MNKFWGLLKREHMLHGAYSFTILAILLFVLIFLPIGFEQYNSNYDAERTRLIAVFGCAIAIVGNAIFMTIASINKDVKIKDLWLPNSQSFYRLVGVKFIYQAVVMFLLSAINFIGLFFVGDIVEGTAIQLLTLAVFYFYVTISVFIFFSILILIFESFLKQLTIWIGKLSYIVGFAVVFFILEFSDSLPSATFLQIGKVNASKLNEYFPTFNDSSIYLDAFMDFYIVEELFYIGVFALLYVIGCKWLERVITR